jgi:hypothetical protein
MVIRAQEVIEVKIEVKKSRSRGPRFRGYGQSRYNDVSFAENYGYDDECTVDENDNSDLFVYSAKVGSENSADWNVNLNVDRGITKHDVTFRIYTQANFWPKASSISRKRT